MRSAFHRRAAGYGFRAQAEEAELLIYDEIGYFGVSARDVVRDLQQVKASTIRLRLNSPGGDVFDGLAIYNALRAHPARIVTQIEGVAASIASIIALAGDEIQIAPNAFVMIHHPFGISIGNAAEHRKMADALDKVAGSLIDTYTDHTGQSRAQVVAWMDDERWFNAEEAEEAGFVDTVTDLTPAAAASFDLTLYRNTPPPLRAETAKEKRRRERSWREAGLSKQAAKQAAKQGQDPPRREADAVVHERIQQLTQKLNPGAAA